MMKLDAPGRDVPSGPRVLRLPRRPCWWWPASRAPRLLAGLARRCGRTGHLLLLDVSAQAALEGQQARRRAMRRSAFATHWGNWRRLRAGLRDPGDPGDPSRLHAEGWASVRLLDRPAADRLVRVVIPGREPTPAAGGSP